MFKKLLVAGVLAAVSLSAAAQMNGGLYYSSSGLAAQAANTVLGNATSGSASPTALSMTSCSTAGSALNYTSNSGFGCNTTVDAVTLNGATFAAPGAIGGGTPGTGAFTTITSTAGSATTAVFVKGGGTDDMVRLGTNTAGGGGDVSAATSTQGALAKLNIVGSSVTVKPAGTTSATFSAGTLALVGTLTASAIVSSGAAQSGYLCYNTTGGVITYDGGATCLVSREETKNYMGPIDSGLKIVLALKPFWGSYKADQPMVDKRVQPFLGARQTALVEPRMVSYDKEGEPLGVHYDTSVAVLVAAIQEQQRQINALQKEVKQIRKARFNVLTSY